MKYFSILTLLLGFGFFQDCFARDADITFYQALQEIESIVGGQYFKGENCEVKLSRDTYGQPSLEIAVIATGRHETFVLIGSTLIRSFYDQPATYDYSYSKKESNWARTSLSLRYFKLSKQWLLSIPGRTDSGVSCTLHSSKEPWIFQ